MCTLSIPVTLALLLVLLSPLGLVVGLDACWFGGQEQLEAV